jgi:glycosyltransferase involved in cell wall biosynthesis
MPSVLIVSHCFPPDFSVGAKRALRMALHLGRRGWRVKVLTVRESYYERLDRSLDRGAAPFQTIRTHAFAFKRRVRRLWQPAQRNGGAPNTASAGVAGGHSTRGDILQFLSSAWDALFAIPDEQGGWLPVAVPSGLMHGGPADIVLATIPPRTSAVIAALVARRLGARLVLDYRDPWMPLPGEPQMPQWRQRLDRALEKFCVTRASLIVATTEGLGRELKAAGGPRTVVIPNAFDPAVFDGIEESRDPRFTITYAGTLSGLRSADPILEGLRRLRETHRLPAAGLVLRVLGASGPEVAAAAERLGVADLVEVRDFVPLREALSDMKGSDALLLVVADNHAHLIPAKLFDYLAARRFILALVPAGSDAGQLIERLGAGAVVDPRDIDAVADALEGRFTQRGAEISLSSAAARYEVDTTMTELDHHLRSLLGEA